MSKLVTIATFENSLEAGVALNVLRENEIKCVLADDNTVSMDWLLGNAVGWVKLQVLDPDAERAVSLLNEKLPAEAPDDEPDEFEEEAEDGIPGTPPPRQEAATAPTAPAPPAREDTARRVFFVSWISLLFPPLAFYGLYLFQLALFGEGELSSRGRIFLLGGAMALTGALAVLWMYLVLFGMR